MSADPSSGRKDATSASKYESLSPAVQHRLHQLFEHATRDAEKNDFDYANDLFSQCVAGDPANLTYLQSFLANLQKKYDNNKKGSKFAGFKGASAKKSMKQAASKHDWKGVIQAGCQMLKLNPWDSATLIAMANACHEMGIDECQLYYLRWALNADPKSVEVNKLAAQQLARMGQFDQAIICWHRVEEAKPGNEEAANAISKLTVEKTIFQGGYDREALQAEGVIGASDSQIGRPRIRPLASSRANEEEENPDEPPKSDEQRLQEAIEAAPEDVGNYLQLADLMSHSQRYQEAEALLVKALEISHQDLNIQEKLEDTQLRRGRLELDVAERRAAESRSPEEMERIRQMRAQMNQRELEVYQTRSQRNPGNASLQYEIGLRLKRAGIFAQAIQAFQNARGDTRRKARVHLELGECFQKIEQYKLAMKEYEAAIDACANRDPEIKKLCLYRAGVLGTGLRDFDRAERHLTELAAMDFGYKDVPARLDKINRLRNSS
ncbi:MAG: hypothetical protein JW829_17940 [Pirellulales bacterium]|nr:hypothetical protein [Pirellulales bacterium]